MVDSVGFAEVWHHGVVTVVVVLENVFQVTGDLVGHHDTMHVSIVITSTRTISKVASDDGIGQRSAVRQLEAHATKEATAIVVGESCVPTLCPTTPNRDVVTSCVFSQDTGVSERFVRDHRASMRVEEVIRGGNDFITDDRIEMAHFYAQVIVGHGAVQLGDSGTVGSPVIPSVVPRVGGSTEGLCIRSISTEDIVHSHSPVPTASASVRGLFDPTIGLLHLETIRVVVEQTRTVAASPFGVITELNPATCVPGSAGICTQKRACFCRTECVT